MELCRFAGTRAPACSRETPVHPARRDDLWRLRRAASYLLLLKAIRVLDPGMADDHSHASLLELVNMRDELSELFGNRPVDVATPSILSNPFRRRTVMRDLETILTASDQDFADL